ncbi:MAG: SDR family NAD(P)-dependent oxidoreductase [Candidatus Dojkabacteria bacterium]
MNKTVLITGASSGFGKATAELLAMNGFKLILISRRKEVLDSIAKDLGTSVHTASVDVTNKEQCEKFFKNIPIEFQDIDILINNAGLAVGLDPVTEANLEDWDLMVNTNIKGLLYFTRSTLEIMKKRNTGLIINIGSVASNVPYKGGNVYGATKAFVKQFSRNLRTDLFGTDIKVSNIEPGMAETEFSVTRFKGDIEKAKKVYEGTRSLQAEDIANTILWIINQPLRVNIDNIEIMPIDQTFGGMVINRSGE